MLPEPTAEHLNIGRQMRAKARTGWYVGTMPTLDAYGARRYVQGAVAPELQVCLLLTRDKMHHSVGWWRNADYEYCWHLSISARERVGWLGACAQQDADAFEKLPYEQLPTDEVRFWARIIFGENHTKAWNEPGGTDPRLSIHEARRNKLIWHLRVFLDPVTFEPFIPEGEVYHLTRWIDGLTPEKVDR